MIVNSSGQPTSKTLDSTKYVDSYKRTFSHSRVIEMFRLGQRAFVRLSVSALTFIAR